MSSKHVFVTLVAATSIALSGALCAQGAVDEAAAAQAYKRKKMDEATAADDRYHANRTAANMRARDKAEAEAAAAITKAQALTDRAERSGEKGAAGAQPR